MCLSKSKYPRTTGACRSECGESKLILRLFLDAKDSSELRFDGGESVGLEHGLVHRHPSEILSMTALRATSMWSGTDWRIGWSGARSSTIRFCWPCKHENCSWRDCDVWLCVWKSCIRIYFFDGGSR